MHIMEQRINPQNNEGLNDWNAGPDDITQGRRVADPPISS